MVKKLSIFAFALLLVSCGQKAKQAEESAEVQTTTEAVAAPDMHTAQNALDYAGTYKGTLPCADCEGIETELTLTEDGKYTLKTTYLGKDATAFEKAGTYSWKEDGSTIVLSDITDAPNHYFVAENQIFQLDMEGNKIIGDLADKYILKKI